MQLAKGIIGKDISQPIPMPVAMCEPSSDMVKRAEDLEYTELLDEVDSLLSQDSGEIWQRGADLL